MREFRTITYGQEKKTNQIHASAMTHARTHAAGALVALGVAACLLASAAIRPTVLHAQSPSPAPGAMDVAPNQLMVRLTAADAPTLAALVAHLGAVDVKRFETVAGLVVVTLPAGLDVWEAGARALELDTVAYAEPNYRVSTQATPNDPNFSLLWGLHNTGQSGGTVGADIKAPEAWNITTGSSNVVVALLDTGIDYNHPDLAANMFRNNADCNANGIDEDGNGYIDDCYGIDTANHDSDPFDDHYHGTHTAGTVGAAGNNSVGVVGVNWNVKLMPCKFLAADGFGDTADAVACLDYIAAMKDRGVNIVATSNSWGGGGYSQALYDAIDAQRQRGILFIAAAGNYALDNDTNAVYPANYDLPNVIAVAATTQSDSLASSFSDFGRRTVHLGAPGYQILSTAPNNSYRTLDGTSMATPHVAGVAALLKAQNPARDWRAIRNLLLAGGDIKSSLSSTTVTGKRLNAYGSLTCTNAPVFSRLKPAQDNITVSVGTPITISALNINCAAGAGDVAVFVVPGNVITLTDTGTGLDQAAGDGIYSGVFVPPSSGTFLMSFPSFPNSTPVLVTAVSSPAIITQPLSQTIFSGQTATMSVTAAGAGPLNYEWWVRPPGGTIWTLIPGATASSYTTPALTTTAYYLALVWNAFGALLSSEAEIAVAADATIAVQPESRLVGYGTTTFLSVQAAGTAPFTYQWYSGTSGTTTNPIAGATSSGYTTLPLTAAASYWVRVTNLYGSPVNSSTATLTIGAVLSGYVRNASTGVPILGATVSINPGNISLTTDILGRYSTIVPSNIYTISAAATHYLPGAPSNMVATGGMTTTQDLALTPVPYLTAVYDPTIKAPKCGAIGSGCDSGALVIGRDTAPGGPEPNQPNTINNSCPDGTGDLFYFYAAIDRVTVSTTTGDPLAAGRTAKIAVTASLFSYENNHLDLYYTTNTSNPVWQYITTISPVGIGLQTLTATYVLPPGGLQAVRANFRWLQAPGACTTDTTTGVYDDRDDLVFAVGTGPVINSQPQSQTIASGQAATLSVGANGSGVTYQWYIGSSGDTSNPIAGATASTTPPLTSAASYWVRVSSTGGNPANSMTATITIGAPPAISSQPTGRTIAAGRTAPLSVVATGTANSYQWYTGPSATTTSPVMGATSASFTTPALTNTTSYWVRVSNPYGAPSNSTTATITVAPSPTITTPSPLPEAFAASAYSVALLASGGATPYTWTTANNTALPSGLTLNSNTGEITGTPNGAGSFTVVVRATGADMLSTDKTLALTVEAVADPLLTRQWHLAESNVEIAGANTRPVWPTTRGAGITIGVVDDGVQGTHADLQANYVAALSHDFRGHDDDPSPNASGPCGTSADCRGTSVAGVAAARGDNGAGGSGVAPLASIAAIRLGAPASDLDEAFAFAHEPNAVQIENISRRDTDAGVNLVAPGPLASQALTAAINVGRNGRGRIFVWAAGDGKVRGDNCNFDGYVNSRYGIAVGAVDDTGQQALYSEPCSALFVSAPSSGLSGNRSLTTTDLAGADGDDPSDDTPRFGGTSAAAPVVSGVVALMLARNPFLTWRDVQHILVRTSRRVNLSDPSWTMGQFPHSEKFGFGVVDALAAVTAAASWPAVAPEASATVFRSPGLAIPNNDGTSASDSASIGSAFAGARVEHVEVELTATHPHRGDLEVTLTSPAGTVSHLATERLSDAGSGFNRWRFGSVRHWGELAGGTWTLTVTDRVTGNVGVLTSWRLSIFGTAPPPPPPPPPPPAPPSGGGGGGGGSAPPAVDPVPSPPAAPAGPGAPTGLAVSVSGSTVVLWWEPSLSGGAPATYILEAGSSSGASNVIVYSTGSAVTSYSAPGVGAGNYFVRVRAANAQGTSAPSNEIVFTVGNGTSSPPSGGPAGPPAGLVASANGSNVLLSWRPPAFGGTPTYYVVQAGTAPGLNDLANFSTGNPVPSFSASGIGAGTYFLRVRAGNAAGIGAPSNEAVMVVGGAGPCAGPPGAPSGLLSNVQGATVSLAWSPASAGPTSYVLEAGSFSGSTDLVVNDLGNAGTSMTATGVGAGTYFVRIRGRNACGTGAPSNEVTVVVR